MSWLTRLFGLGHPPPIPPSADVEGPHRAQVIDAAPTAAPPSAAAGRAPTNGAGPAIRAVLDGSTGVAGEDTAKTPLPTGATSVGVGRSVWRRLGRSMGLGGAPVRPRREDYATGEAWDRAYLAYQDAQMAELARRYPRAVLHTAVWHGCDLPPEVVLKSGIPAKDGWSFDLEAHQRETGRTPEESSALRGGCVDARTPGLFASEGQWVYLLVPRGGVISLADALRDRDLLPGETELSFGARQPAQQIQGWRKVLGFSETVGAYRLGPLEPNPNFDPRR